MASKILYLEPVGGIAGNMFLAAAVDLGISTESIERPLRGLGLTGWKLEVQQEERHAVQGLHLNVAEERTEPGNGSASDLQDERTQGRNAAKSRQAHRSLPEIRKMVRRAPELSPRVKERALAIFQRLGEAEAASRRVHLDEIDFLEAGALGSIVDICGAALAVELLGDPEVVCAPPPLGSGTIKTPDGALPVPTPTTLELLRGIPVRFEGVGQLTTPVGAALIKVLARVGSPPQMVVEKIGVGLGSKDFADRANVLRASLGASSQGITETAFALEASLEDCNPQLLGTLVETLREQGALEAYVVPATMGGGRPGHLLTAVAPEAKRKALIETILRESTALGVREHRVERTVLEQELEEIGTPYGSVRVRLGLREGQVLNAAPEYGDCVRLARAAKVSVKTVWSAALAGSRYLP